MGTAGFIPSTVVTLNSKTNYKVPIASAAHSNGPASTQRAQYAQYPLTKESKV